VKSNSLLLFAGICLFLLPSLSIKCAEKKNDNIGPFDLMLLKRSVNDRGTKALKKEIKHYNFKRVAPMECYPPIYWNTPFCITYRVQNDGSIFSKEVFDKIEPVSQGAIFVSRNELNTRNSDKKAHNCVGTVKAGTYIDDCTTYRQLPDSVEVTARFYDKDALLKALKRLSKS